MTRPDAWRRAIVCAAVVVTLDQVTKQLADHGIKRGDHVNIFFGIDLTNTRNTGVAFGALAGGGALITALTLVALGVLVVYFAFRATKQWLWLPVGMVVGGALGNLADRARDGAVIDFFDPVLWPAFNLADAAVVLGILGLLYIVDTSRE